MQLLIVLGIHLLAFCAYIHLAKPLNQSNGTAKKLPQDLCCLVYRRRVLFMSLGKKIVCSRGKRITRSLPECVVKQSNMIMRGEVLDRIAFRYHVLINCIGLRSLTVPMSQCCPSYNSPSYKSILQVPRSRSILSLTRDLTHN